MLKKIQQIKLMSKPGLALIATTVISVVMGVQALSSSYYFIQAADAQPRLPNNSVRSESIVNGEVNTQDLASGAVKPNVHIVRTEEITLSPGDGLNRGVDCPAGEIVTGGGLRTSQNLLVRLHSTFPQDENTWSVAAINDGPGDSVVTLYAACIGPSP